MYEKIRNELKIGYVIAFSGKGRVSRIIKWKTDSEISHIGMIYKIDALGIARIQLIESTTLGNLPDIKEGKVRKGVQLQFLSQRLDTYNGEAWVYILKDKIEGEWLVDMLTWLTDVHTKKIDYDTFQAIGAGMDLFDMIPGIEMEPDFSSLFCSELVSKALKIAGIIVDEINPSEQTPADVCRYSCFETPIKIK